MVYSNFKEYIFSAHSWRLWLYIVLGCFLMSSGFVLFINPYKIVPGGVYGLGIVMHQLFPSIQVGTFGFMFDIPLLLIAFKVFGRMFGAKTIVAAVLVPTIMNLMTYMIGEDPASMLGGRINLSDDIIVACIFGGILIGSGVGFIIKTRATSGGTDIVAMLLSHFANLTFSRGILIVDSIVVVFGIFVLGDWRLPLYSLVTIYVSARIIDYVLDGASYDKLLFIISDQHEQIRNFVLEDMGRGGTYINSSGMYNHDNKEMIFLVVSRREVSTVQQQIHALDPKSFVVVVNAYETFGDGFKAFPEKI